MRGMTGAELLDRDRAGDAEEDEGAYGAGSADSAGRLRYRDPLGLVQEGRPLGRPAKILAVVAVCGAGLLAGLGLFGGSAAKRPEPAGGIVKAGATVDTRPDTVRHQLAHRPPTHKPHVYTPRTHRPAKQPTYPAHPSPSHIPVHTPSGHGAHHVSPLTRPATARHAAPAATARTAPPHSSPGTAPAASR